MKKIITTIVAAIMAVNMTVSATVKAEAEEAHNTYIAFRTCDIVRYMHEVPVGSVIQYSDDTMNIEYEYNKAMTRAQAEMIVKTFFSNAAGRVTLARLGMTIDDYIEYCTHPYWTACSMYGTSNLVMHI